MQAIFHPGDILRRNPFRCRSSIIFPNLRPPARGEGLRKVGKSFELGVNGGGCFSGNGDGAFTDVVPGAAAVIISVNICAAGVNQTGFWQQVQSVDIVSTRYHAACQEQQAETENTQPRKHSSQIRQRGALPPSFSHNNDYLREVQVWRVVVRGHRRVVGLRARVTPLPASKDQTGLLHG